MRHNPLNDMLTTPRALEWVEELVAAHRDSQPVPADADEDSQDPDAVSDTNEDGTYLWPHLLSPVFTLLQNPIATEPELGDGWSNNVPVRDDNPFLCPECTQRFDELEKRRSQDTAKSLGLTGFVAGAINNTTRHIQSDYPGEHDACEFCQQAVQTILTFSRYYRRPGSETDGEKAADEIELLKRARDWQALFAINPPEGRRIDTDAEWVRIVALDKEAATHETFRIGAIHLAVDRVTPIGSNNARNAYVALEEAELYLAPHEFQTTSVERVQTLGTHMKPVLVTPDAKLDADNEQRLFYMMSRGMSRPQALMIVAVAWRIPGIVAFVPVVEVEAALKEAAKIEQNLDTRAAKGEKLKGTNADHPALPRWAKAMTTYLADNEIDVKPSSVQVNCLRPEWGLIGANYKMPDGTKTFVETRMSIVATYLEAA